jgi:hypothetical protein
MKYQFKGFYHVAPRKQSLSGDGSFIYPVVYFLHNTTDNSVVSDIAEIGVPATTTNADTDPFIVSQLMMRVNAMWNKAN